MNIFGPVPSRRLGRSLGVNNIPFKTCSYSCKYCQLGKTNKLSIKRKEYLEPEDILKEVNTCVKSLKKMNENIDYITLVPDGEPTLDINLGSIIKLLKTTGVKTAVISNASLIGDDSVKEDLQCADWVSVKIDSADTEIWKNINRPHGKLNLDVITKGLLEFASTYNGTLVTETMLVHNGNDGFASLTKTVEFIERLDAEKSYILIPIRPPAEASVKAPSIERLVAIYKLFKGKVGEAELIMNNEGVDFSFINNVEDELLGITAVHPMREEAVEDYLSRSNSSWQVVKNLMKRNLIKEVNYGNEKYYMRNFSAISSLKQQS